MILESEIENKLISELSSISGLSSVQFIGSRQTAGIQDEMISDNDEVDSIIAIHTGYRSNDAFSLSPVTVPVALTISTRVERDKSGQIHETITEKISDKLSYWHKFSNQFTTDFSGLQKVFVGELTMTGGTGRTYNDDNRVWNDTISFSIRGSERFNI